MEYISKYDFNNLDEKNSKEHIEELFNFINSNIKTLSLEESSKYIKMLRDLCNRYRRLSWTKRID